MCVCLSECVSITLSVHDAIDFAFSSLCFYSWTRLTRQTPQQIFTVDSLKDVDLRKDVPFGGLDDE